MAKVKVLVAQKRRVDTFSTSQAANHGWAVNIKSHTMKTQPTITDDDRNDIIASITDTDAEFLDLCNKSTALPNSLDADQFEAACLALLN